MLFRSGPARGRQVESFVGRRHWNPGGLGSLENGDWTGDTRHGNADLGATCSSEMDVASRPPVMRGSMVAGREAQEPPVRLPPSGLSQSLNPGTQEAIPLASSTSVSCRQSRPFGFRFWGGTGSGAEQSTSRLEAAVCLWAVCCDLRAGLAMDRECVWLLGTGSSLVRRSLRGKWRLEFGRR